MRSQELAGLAGVTVKTLRHYHKIGILPEPGRKANNYRSYSAQHLARLLRIKRLAGLGLSLDRIAHMLADETEAENALCGLSQELRSQAEHLNRQMETIASLRAGNSAPDIPLQLAGFYNRLSMLPEKARVGLREQLVLLELAVDDEHMPLLVRYFDRLIAPDVLDTVLAISQSFYLLGPDSSPESVEELVAACAVVFRAVAPEFSALSTRAPANPRAKFLFEHIIVNLNKQQREAFLAVVLRINDTAIDAA